MTQDNNRNYYGMLIHGGLKSRKLHNANQSVEALKKALQRSILAGFTLLRKNSSAIDAVEASVISMEDSGNFNAGVGSCLTIDRNVEMDASIMNGIDISAGSVGMVKDVINPIRLARHVMDHTNHVMLVSDGAIKLAKILGMYSNESKINAKNFITYERLKQKIKKDLKSEPNTKYYDTVGSIAIDKEGNVAAAASTGGIWLKMSGRVGDAGVIGSGLYADNKLGAACATGHGEFIMRLCLCKYACDSNKHQDASLASKKSIALLTKKFGKNTGGIITVDRNGNFGVSHNAVFMPAVSINSKDEKIRSYFNTN